MAKCGPTLSFQFQIRALESQKRQQEIVLRRKTQEVRALIRLALKLPSSKQWGVGRMDAWAGNRDGRMDDHATCGLDLLSLSEHSLAKL